MLMNRKIIVICFSLILGLLSLNSANAQCDIIVDTANITQVTCPGGADGFASLAQTPYTVYSWYNVTAGVSYGIGAVTSVNTLGAGLYVVTGSGPLQASCPQTMISDTFEIVRN